MREHDRNATATGQRMFAAFAADDLDALLEINPKQFVAQGNTVVVFGNESGTVKATGQPITTSGCKSMWWRKA
jgi:hypothetical protein